MERGTTIKQINAHPGQRILVMSDIHGHMDNLFHLLKKLDYTRDDILVIIGDLIDKGPDSLRTLRYVMELSERGNIYVSMGNVDLHRYSILTDVSEEADRNFLEHARWVKEYWQGGLIPDMLSELGIDIKHLTQENAGETRLRLLEHFQKEIAFIGELPTILTMGKYIFVHGGVPTENLDELVGTNALPLLKNDAFLNKGTCFSEHTVVVGHFPVCLYREGMDDLSPIFLKDRGIISIDGGCGVKLHGQLNALSIPDLKADMDEILWDFCDVFPVVRAMEKQKGRPGTLQIQYFDCEVEVLDSTDDDRSVTENNISATANKGKESLLHFKHISTGGEFDAPTSFLWEYQGRKHCSDYCDEQLSVTPGDELHVLADTDRGLLVKKKGRMGWYYGAYEELDTGMWRVQGARC